MRMHQITVHFPHGPKSRQIHAVIRITARWPTIRGRSVKSSRKRVRITANSHPLENQVVNHVPTFDRNSDISKLHV